LESARTFKTVGILIGAIAGFLLWLLTGLKLVPAVAVFSLAGGMAGFFGGLALDRRIPSPGSVLVVSGGRALGIILSCTAVLLFAYLLAFRIRSFYVLFSLALSATALTARVAPEARRSRLLAVDSGILALVGVVGGVANRDPVLLAIGLLSSLGMLAPFMERRRRAKAAGR